MMSDMKKHAKKSMLKELMSEMIGLEGEGYGDLLKDKMLSVKIAADSKKGLESGLTKAQKLLKARLGDSEMLEDEKPSKVEELDETDEMEEMESEEEMEDVESEDLEESEESEELEESETPDEKVKRLEKKLAKMSR